ncbi:unnamed protein product [Brassica rapa]|uniref:Uncharacterized protein n=2 Tax=Brassica TaxID=3705 RepID=A0A8D9MF53_BRACM|nr:unnamed protein product [Brassica napus]CAG7865132.1 unnamed protein product [Brassica rapa]CAG7907962.1 unnamed protein product [Brassica rapa]CAG7907972.1 unnamed protein product [Brassica rapa]
MVRKNAIEAAYSFRCGKMPRKKKNIKVEDKHKTDSICDIIS